MKDLMRLQWPMITVLLIVTLSMAPATAQEVERVLLVHQIDIVDLCSDRPGNVYILAEFHGVAEVRGSSYTSRGESDLLLICILPDGSPGWVRQIKGPNNERGGGVAVDSMGNIAVVGSFERTLSIGGITLTGECADLDRRLEQSCEDIFVARYAPDGSALWAKRAGGRYGDRGTSVAAGADGSIYLTGFIQDTASFGDGGEIAGSPQSLFIARYDSMGRFVWDLHTDGSGWASGSRIALRRERIWVAGNFSGAVVLDGAPVSGGENGAALLIGANTSGASLWAGTIGGSGPGSAAGVAADDDGNVYLAGSFTGTVALGSFQLQSAGGSDIMVASFDSSGAPRWIRRSGGVGEDKGEGLTMGASGAVVATGSFSASAQFGERTLSAAGGSDIIVMRCDPVTGMARDAMAIGGNAVDIGRVIASGAPGRMLLGGTIQNDVRMGSTTQKGGNGASFVAWLLDRSSGIDDTFREGKDGMIVPNGDRPDLSSTSRDRSHPISP